jgi:SagB-type dehydrogenase family enzyme
VPSDESDGAMTISRLAATLVASVALCGCADDETAVAPGAPPGSMTMPEATQDADMGLEQALAARRSIRSFADEPLTLDEISQLTWAAQGLTEEGGAGRTAPSAGGTYPLEMYVATPDGVYHYVPDGHLLEVVQGEDLRAPLAAAALDQLWVADAAIVVVITAVFARTEQRYGDRAERYVHLEAGHAAQNVLLQAVALDLGAVPVGAFRDEEVQEVLGLPGDHEPLYLIPVGRPAE